MGSTRWLEGIWCRANPEGLGGRGGHKMGVGLILGHSRLGRDRVWSQSGVGVGADQVGRDAVQSGVALPGRGGDPVPGWGWDLVVAQSGWGRIQPQSEQERLWVEMGSGRDPIGSGFGLEGRIRSPPSGESCRIGAGSGLEPIGSRSGLGWDLVPVQSGVTLGWAGIWSRDGGLGQDPVWSQSGETVGRGGIQPRANQEGL